MQGLKRTYNKQLEVFECAIDDERSNDDSIFINNTKAIHKYHAAKKQWIRKSSAKTVYSRCRRTQIHATSTTTYASCGGYVVFTTLEAAQASKLIMIEQLKKAYEEELERLRALFRRNVPNIDEPMNQLLEEHPDLFI